MQLGAYRKTEWEDLSRQPSDREMEVGNWGVEEGKRSLDEGEDKRKERERESENRRRVEV